MIPEEQLLDKLNTLYKRTLKAESPKTFYNALYKFMDTYELNPILEPIGTLIEKGEAEELAPFYKLDEEIRKKMREVLNKVTAFIAIHHLTNTKIIEDIKIFECAIHLPLESGLYSIPNLYIILKDILIQLHDISPSCELLRQLATINKAGEIKEFTFLPSLDKWQTLKSKIENTKETRIWYEWHMLIKFYRDNNPNKYAQENENEIDLYKQRLHSVYDFTKENIPVLIQNIQSTKKITIQTSEVASKNKTNEPNKTFKPSKHHVTVEKTLNKKKILLSTDGKNDIALELFKKAKPSEQTNQIKFFFEIIKGPIAKYKLNKTLGLSNKQIDKAYSTINGLVRDNWKIAEQYVIYNEKHGEYRINSNYPTKFNNL